METEARITGVMVYYYFVCKRKLWYFTHEIQMEQENEAVKLGKVLDESVYGRENKHMDIDQTRQKSITFSINDLCLGTVDLFFNRENLFFVK